MPGPGPDQRSRNRRPRRRGPSSFRAPVSEYEEQQELEAARERNDLHVADLREMSVTELRRVGRDLELDTAAGDRKDELVDRILQRQTERAGHDYASGILDIVDEGFGFMRRHGLLPSPEDVYVSSSQVRRFGLRIGDRISGAVRAPREAEKYWGMLRVDAVNGVDTETARRRPVFGDLTDDLSQVRSLNGLSGESYVDKDLRSLLGDRVSGPFNVRYCGNGSLAACRASLWSAIRQAADGLQAQLGKSNPAEWIKPAARTSFVPGLLPDTFPTTNRPTFQQVLELQRHP